MTNASNLLIHRGGYKLVKQKTIDGRMDGEEKMQWKRKTKDGRGNEIHQRLYNVIQFGIFNAPLTPFVCKT